MWHFMARRTTTRFPQTGAKALTSPRVPPNLFSFSDAPVTATDFGFSTERNDSRNTSFIYYPPNNFNPTQIPYARSKSEYPFRRRENRSE